MTGGDDPAGMSSGRPVDGRSSSPAIHEAMPAFAILPVGSCEQHGAHLPLLTDTLTVERVVTAVGALLGGFVLPTLPYGTSYEHLGFAGTVSLRYATLARVVTDIVESCFEQGVGTVFVISGHGGNFILNPCVRELNRSQLAGRRVVLVPEDIYLGPGLAKDRQDDFHAGRWETAILASLEPELVDLSAAVDHVPTGATRADLTNRPFRELTRSGVWGYPSGASAEEGRELFTACVSRVAAFVSAWLDGKG